MGQPVHMTRSERDAYRRGRRCFERGEVEEALRVLSGVARAREDFADVHYMMGVLHDERGELDDAAACLRRAIRQNPSYAEALLALASVTERQGDFERSRELAERAAMVSRGAPGRLDPTTRGKLANLQAELGDALRGAGELRDAVEAYRQALERCPDFHDIRFRLAVALRELGLPDRAQRELVRVLRANPDFLDARVQLGVTLYSLGRSQDALGEWRAVLERDPGREDARMYGRLVEAAERRRAREARRAASGGEEGDRGEPRRNADAPRPEPWRPPEPPGVP